MVTTIIIINNISDNKNTDFNFSNNFAKYWQNLATAFFIILSLGSLNFMGPQLTQKQRHLHLYDHNDTIRITYGKSHV